MARGEMALSDNYKLSDINITHTADDLRDHYGYAQDIITYNYNDWEETFINGVYQPNHAAEIEIAPVEPNNIVFNAGPENDEMLKITQDGFYVRGVKVPQDAREAEAVYKAFRQWMTWNALTS